LPDGAGLEKLKLELRKRVTKLRAKEKKAAAAAHEKGGARLRARLLDRFRV